MPSNTIPDAIIPFDINDPEQVAVLQQLVMEERLVARKPLTSTIGGKESGVQFQNIFFTDVNGKLYQLVPEAQLGQELGFLEDRQGIAHEDMPIIALTQTQARRLADQNLNLTTLDRDNAGVCSVGMGDAELDDSIYIIDEDSFPTPEDTYGRLGQTLPDADAQAEVIEQMRLLQEYGLVGAVSKEGIPFYRKEENVILPDNTPPSVRPCETGTPGGNL
ncbi:hypothetical protein GC177_09605 [bacterium]|nr:hypothetical protein [bacterium]